jgi:hypothetical protein
VFEISFSMHWCHFIIYRSRQPFSCKFAHTPNSMPNINHSVNTKRLCDQGASSGALVSPGWWEDTDGLVVSREAVDSGLDENKSKLGILVLSVALKMLADSDSLR